MRITNNFRDRLGDLLVERAFADEKKALEAESNRVALLFYRDTFSEELEKKLDAINAEIPGLISVDSYFVVYPKDMGRTDLKLEFARPTGTFNEHQMKGNASDATWAEISAYSLKFSDYQTRRNEAASKAEGTLSSFHTFEKLVKAWPEVEPLAREVADRLGAIAPAQPLAVDVATLNATFDLPVSEKIAA